MPVGPFDHRKRRFRCGVCSTSHLKTGIVPILVDKGKQKTVASFVTTLQTRPTGLQLTKTPRSDPTLFYFYYFDVFLRKNNFSCQGKSSVDIQELMQRSTSGGYLKNAVLSLGAMEAVKLRSADGPSQHQNYQFALNSYMNSVGGLRDALEHHTQRPHLRLNVLWTTLLLGLFELMSDSTGQGWVQHIVHGTSKALVASGPLACQASFGKRFFIEVKIFEVCRAIIFNEPTFLAQSECKALSVKLQTEHVEAEMHPLGELLDIIVSCSSLRVRASDFIHASSPAPEDRLMDAHDISIEGFRQREALNAWNTKNPALLQGHLKPDGTLETDDFILLARTFFAATSIYLSGVFDYEITHWQDLGVLVATLGEDEIQIHVQTILETCSIVLDRSSVSPALLLFPLRVAGSRSWQLWQQAWILNLLDKVGLTFSVAAAFRSDLSELWAQWPDQ
ncbi:hypothetical protein AK830_g1635 [Neonectria ditissima]|uniref:Transcription factor domain-containing protein n=1 Tax=Neonectria ditissima TaxID=78410 RepID=A0A0P7B5K4_9HYPO|nr:hypothetical protein AK830_g1635 [Neonectria ditissima]